MGNRGHNAGGYAWMDWRTCACGRKFIIGKRNPQRRCMRCRKSPGGRAASKDPVR
jgi:hypothetical protein